MFMDQKAKYWYNKHVSNWSIGSIPIKMLAVFFFLLVEVDKLILKFIGKITNHKRQKLINWTLQTLNYQEQKTSHTLEGNIGKTCMW